ncbi:MAG: hypothetical protein GY757_33780, partial [bacterium]|nr:hypothetical protein [bacterium]
KPDIGLCCFYPRLFEKSFFSIPRCGFYNTHFSPLPKYRGALPIPYAIMNDEKEHGVTIHRITRGMDSGPIVAQAMVPIYPDDTGCDLYARLEKSGAPLFRETVRRFIEAGGKLPLRRQDKTKIISHVRSDFKSMEVDRQWNPKKIYNFVRAFDFPPFPLTYIMINNEKFYLALKPGRHSYAADAWKSKKFGKLELFMMREAN